MSKKYVLNSFAILAASALIGASAHAEGQSGTHDTSIETEQESKSQMGMDNEKMKEQRKDMQSKMHSESESEEQASKDATSSEEWESEAATGEMDSVGGIAGETDSDTGATSDISTTEPMSDESETTVETSPTVEETPESTTADTQIETQPMDDTTMASMDREQVRQLQEKLNSEISANLQTDGIFGPKTRQALRQYQQDNNLTVTGTPNQDTMTSLGMSMDQEAERRPASVPSEPTQPSQPESLDNEMETEQSSPVMESEDSSINSEQLNEKVD